MGLLLDLSPDYPSEHQPQMYDVIKLAEGKKWSELNKVPICIDRHGIVRTRFGQNRWDCSPFAADKGTDKNQREFDFSYLSENSELRLQAKLIVYGWLFEQGHCFSRKCKLSTLTSRFNIGLKKILVHLLNVGENDISILGRLDKWQELEDHIENLSLSSRTITLAFTALLSVERLNSWLNLNFEIPISNANERAKKLADKEKSVKKQTLAIPQSLVNIIYGEAVKIID